MKRGPGSEVWLTPKPLVDLLGPFDLDPCAAPEPRPWPTAREHYTKAEGDGLGRPWNGFVWCNPPYGRETGRWLERLASHPGGGIALVFARTETDWFFEHVWKKGRGFLFLKGRVRFHRPDGTRNLYTPAPSVLIAYGDEASRRLYCSGLAGCSVVAWEPRLSRPEAGAVGLVNTHISERYRNEGAGK